MTVMHRLLAATESPGKPVINVTEAAARRIGAWSGIVIGAVLGMSVGLVIGWLLPLETTEYISIVLAIAAALMGAYLGAEIGAGGGLVGLGVGGYTGYCLGAPLSACTPGVCAILGLMAGSLIGRRWGASAGSRAASSTNLTFALSPLAAFAGACLGAGWVGWAADSHPVTNAEAGMLVGLVAALALILGGIAIFITLFVIAPRAKQVVLKFDRMAAVAGLCVSIILAAGLYLALPSRRVWLALDPPLEIWNRYGYVVPDDAAPPAPAWHPGVRKHAPGVTSQPRHAHVPFRRWRRRRE